MVLLFNPSCFTIYKGTADKAGSISLTSSYFNHYLSEFETTLNILIRDHSEKIKVVQLSLTKSQNFIVILNPYENEICDFFVIVSSLFNSSQIREKVVFHLGKQIKQLPKISGGQLPEILKMIEENISKKISNDYLDYFPLLVTSYLEELERQNDSKNNELFKNGDKNCILTLLYTILLREKKTNIEDLFLDLDSTLSYASDIEKGKLFYNLAIFAYRTKQSILFSHIVQILLSNDLGLINDFTRCLIAQQMFTKDSAKALSVISHINYENLQILSENALIRLHRLKGAIYEKEKRYSEGLSEYYSAVSLLKSQVNISPDLALAYAGIGNINGLIGNYSKAISAYAFSANLLKFLSLSNQQLMMENNIRTLRSIKAKNYLAASLISFNDEKYTEAVEYTEKAINEFALLFLDASNSNLEKIASDTLSQISTLLIRRLIDSNVKIHLDSIFPQLSKLEEVITKIISTKKLDSELISELKLLSLTKGAQIYQVIIVHRDGRVIISKKFENIIAEEGKDLIFAGALSAIQMILDETFLSDKVYTIDAGERKILYRKGDLVQIVVITNKVSEQILAEADIFLGKVESGYKDILYEWDGNLGDFDGVDDLMGEVFSNLEHNNEII